MRQLWCVVLVRRSLIRRMTRQLNKRRCIDCRHVFTVDEATKWTMNDTSSGRNVGEDQASVRDD